MKKYITSLTSIALLVSACGISKDEHQKALDMQKADYLAQMEAQKNAHDGAMKKKNGEVAALEDEVSKLGGDIKNVRSELGERESELAASNAELRQLRMLREAAVREAAQYKNLTEKFQSMIDAGELEVTKRKGRLILNLPDAILFPSGQSSVLKKGQAALKSVANVLKEVNDRNFLITGHTDNVPVRKGGKFKDNWQLSTARAVEVVRLMTKEGVAPEHLAAAGYGEFDPIADNSTTEGRTKNRRLEIVLMPKIEDVTP